MLSRLLIASALMGLVSNQAVSQTYNYTARTAEPVRQSGAVTASGLTWRCSKRACTISGPWPAPGVGACAALAARVGRIVEYGHPGNRLSAAQLETCNDGLAAPQNMIKAAPGMREALRRPERVPPNRQARSPAISPVRPSAEAQTQIKPHEEPQPASAPSGARLRLEEGSFGVYRLYIQPRDALSFHGTYAGDYPPFAPETAVATWRGDVLTLPGLSHAGADHPDEQILPGGDVPEDSAVETAPSGAFLEIPLDFTSIPQRVSAIDVSCRLSPVSIGTDVVVTGPFSEQNEIGFAEARFWRRATSDGDWALRETTSLPVNLRPLQQIEDAKSIQCFTRVVVRRIGTPGVDQIPLEAAMDPTSRRFVAGLATAPGTRTAFRLRANVGGI